MQLKWRIESVTHGPIQTFDPPGTLAARNKFLVLVAELAATDPVHGPDFIARAKAITFTALKPPWYSYFILTLDPGDTQFVLNYVRAATWWE